MQRVAMLSVHTSPLAQPGTGDGGGMNVYVRSLASALARAGVAVDVLTRAEHRDHGESVVVEPGLGRCPEIAVVSGLVRTARPTHWVHDRLPFLCASAMAGAVRENDGSIRGAKQVVRAPPERSRGGKPDRCSTFAMRTAVL